MRSSITVLFLLVLCSLYIIYVYVFYGAPFSFSIDILLSARFVSINFLNGVSPLSVFFLIGGIYAGGKHFSII